VGRGEKRLDVRQLALLQKVRDARAEWEGLHAELAREIEILTQTKTAEAEASARARIWAAVDSGVPLSKIKTAFRHSDHRTFKERWLAGYVEPAEWHYTFQDNEEYGRQATVERFLTYSLEIVYVVDEQGILDLSVGGQDKDAAAELLSTDPEVKARWDVMMAEIEGKLSK